MPRTRTRESRIYPISPNKLAFYNPRTWEEVETALRRMFNLTSIALDTLMNGIKAHYSGVQFGIASHTTINIDNHKWKFFHTYFNNNNNSYTSCVIFEVHKCYTD